MKQMKHRILIFTFLLFGIQGYNQCVQLLPAGITADLESVYFTSEQQGYVAGAKGQLWQTTNGGESWTSRDTRSGQDLHSLHFNDSNTGWLTGAGGIIRHTTNGGTIWRQQYSPVRNDLYNVHFNSAADGLIAGACGTLLRTTDGGDNWQLAASGTGNALHSVCFVNAQIALAAGEGGICLRSTDGGQSWSTVAGTGNGDIFGLAAEGMNVWMSSTNGMYYSSDGGANWQLQGTGGSFYSADIPESSACIAVGADGQITRTTDGGGNWVNIGSGVLSSTLKSVIFPTANVGYAVGEAGAVVRIQFPKADAGTDISVCEEEMLLLQGASDMSDGQYSWQGPADYSSSQQSPVLMNSTQVMAGNYVLEVNVQDCTDRDTVEAEVLAISRDTLRTATPLCYEGSLMVNGTTYNRNQPYGEEVFIGQSANGCDSIVLVDLSFLPENVVDLEETICAGATYTVGSSEYSTNGSYHDVLVSSMGCDSTVHLQLAVTSVLETELMEQICEGESYSIGNQTYNQSGNYTKTLTATSGCDSIVHLALTVLTIHETNLTEQICEGESYLIDNQDYDQSGDYSVTLSSFAGCDSTVNLSLTVASVIETYITEQICEGESFVVNGEVFTETGEYQRPLTASSGCDSIVNLSLSVLPNVSLFLEAEICDGESYWIGTTSYQTEGTYEQTLLTLNGCDSTVSLQLSVIDEASIGAAFAGEDQTTCLEDIQMQADLPPATSGYWTTTSSAILDDPASPNTFVYELAEGENTFTWTLSTTECVDYSSDAVVIELITTAPDAQDNDYTFSYPDGTLTGNLVINDILHASLEWVVEVINKPIIGALDLSTDGQFTYELAGIAEQTVFEYEIYYQDCPQLRDTARVEIQITDLPSGEEVTGFSPDGDGVNDTYVIPEIEENPELYPDNEFIVFNRWGQIVYQESPYQNQWDGTLLDTGTPLPAGTYYYIIRLVLAGGKIPNISEKATIRDGQVTIFR